MPRYQRDTFLNGYTYHIYNVTAGNTTLFQEEIDYDNFLAKYKKYLAPYFDTYAYCLIPNHYHIIAKVKDSFSGIIDKENTTASKNYLENGATEGEFLENQLSRMFSSIAITYNNKYNRKGPLFKEGTKRVIIKTQERLIDQICYTHRNSIHHGLVADYKDWKYNSYNSYLSAGDTLIKREEILELFGGRKMFILTHENYKKGMNKDFFE